MSVEQARVIDVISLEKATGNVLLTISDHLDWTQHEDHLRLLEEKLNYYLAFVESGEVLQSYPTAGGRTIVVEVIFKYAPDSAALRFLERVRQTIEQSGLHFRFSHLSIA
jgi:hypothetical protein